MAAVGRSENHAVVANDRANIGIDKINAEEACCLAGLRSPRLPAICRSDNCSAEEAHGGAVIFVDSLQTGDAPDYDALLDYFPVGFHEPYYASYLVEDLDRLVGPGFTPEARTLAYFSKVVAYRCDGPPRPTTTCS